MNGILPCMVYVDEEGKLWHVKDETRSEIFRPDILEIFFDNARVDGQGRYLVLWQNQECYLEVADTLFVVQRAAMEKDDDRVTLWLNDGQSEPLDPATLRMGQDNVIYCSVKDGRFPARFNRAAYYQLAERIEEEDGRFFVSIGGSKHFIS